jgi:glycosyltransferase involved in cell wall biosynthesis
MVWLLAQELLALKHEVTIFCAEGSESAAEVIETLPIPAPHAREIQDWKLGEWVNLCCAVQQARRFDVLHSHAYLYALPLQQLSTTPFVHTMHLMGGEEFSRLWEAFPDACVSAISRSQWSTYPTLSPAAIIMPGVDPLRFAFREVPNDYLCYFGPFLAGRGVLQAIAAARSLGLRLLLAGPRTEYYQSTVFPLLDAKHVEYVGDVQGALRAEVLAGARALLHPVSYPEPAALAVFEALMCGTPVAAIRNGAMTEILDECITGCMAESLAQFGDAVVQALSLDRRQVRIRAELRFSSARMAADYVQLYERVIAATAIRSQFTRVRA